MSCPTSDLWYPVTWDQLLNILEKEFKNSSYWLRDVCGCVQEAFACELQVIGPRYYLVFATDEDLIYFRLRYL